MHLGVVCILVSLVDLLVVGSMGLLIGKGGCEFWSMKLASPSLEGVDVGGREYKGEELSGTTSLESGAWRQQLLYTWLLISNCERRC